MSIKGFLTAIGLLVLLLIGISFFVPKDMNLSVTEELAATPEQVFAQVNNVKNWQNWSPWFSLDPAMEITYGDIESGEGASYVWSSDKRSVGNGAMFINESVPYSKVGTTVKFEGYDDSEADFAISPSANGGSVVVWDFSSDFKANMPWEKFNIAMGRMMLKKSYSKGLAAIDAYVKEHPELPEVKADLSEAIKQTEVPSFQGITVMRSGKISELEAHGEEVFGGAFGEVMETVKSVMDLVRLTKFQRQFVRVSIKQKKT